MDNLPMHQGTYTNYEPPVGSSLNFKAKPRFAWANLFLCLSTKVCPCETKPDHRIKLPIKIFLHSFVTACLAYTLEYYITISLISFFTQISTFSIQCPVYVKNTFSRFVSLSYNGEILCHVLERTGVRSQYSIDFNRL